MIVLCFPFCFLFFGMVILTVILCILSKVFRKAEIFCEYNFHLDPTEEYMDGGSIKGKCPRCGREMFKNYKGLWK